MLSLEQLGPGDVIAIATAVASGLSTVAYLSSRFTRLETHVSDMGRSLDVVREDVRELRSRK